MPGVQESLRKKIEGLPGGGSGEEHLSFSLASEELWGEEKEE